MVILFAVMIVAFTLAAAGNMVLPVVWPTLGLAVLLLAGLGCARFLGAALHAVRQAQGTARRGSMIGMAESVPQAETSGAARRGPGPAAGRRIRARMPQSQQDMLFRALLARETAETRPLRPV